MKTKDKKIVEILADAAHLVSVPGYSPDNMWVPEFGWVIENGALTDEGKEWATYLNKQRKI